MDLFPDRFSFINIERFTQNLFLVPNVQSNNLYPQYNRQQQSCEDDIGHLLCYFHFLLILANNLQEAKKEFQMNKKKRVILW